MLNKSLSMMLDDFKEEWRHKKTLIEEQCTRLEQAVRERAEAQRHHLERKFELQRVPPVKYSSSTRDMIKQGKKLADAQCYDEVIRLHSKLDKIQTAEQEQWLAKVNAKQAHGRKALLQRLNLPLGSSQIPHHGTEASRPAGRLRRAPTRRSSPWRRALAATSAATEETPALRWRRWCS